MDPTTEMIEEPVENKEVGALHKDGSDGEMKGEEELTPKKLTPLQEGFQTFF